MDGHPAYLRGQRFRPSLGSVVVHRDERPLLGEVPADGLADATGPTRNEHYLPTQSCVHVSCDWTALITTT